MTTEFTILLTQEQINLLQRAGNEVDTKYFIIDRLFSTHINDKDAELLNSKSFKYYIDLYEQAYITWQLTVRYIETNIILPIVQQITGVQKPSFNWTVEDYVARECKVKVVNYE